MTISAGFGDRFVPTNPVTLILTNSIDAVADLLVDRIGSENIFRYNMDLWRSYRLIWSGAQFELEDPSGRRVTGDRITKVFRRCLIRETELFPDRPYTLTDRFLEEEVWTAWQDIIDVLWQEGKVVLIQPFRAGQPFKLMQLRLAERFFSVTPHRFIIGASDTLQAGRTSVAKSFNFAFDRGVGFYATKVMESDLDPAQPWFLNDYVEAHQDVTVVFVRDELFAFALDREPFLKETIDWRLADFEYSHREWKRIELPSKLIKSIFAFMGELGCHYSRLDFLKTTDDYIFLEANFTGEWVWLDPLWTNGLNDKIVREIHPATPLFSVPLLRWYVPDE